MNDRRTDEVSGERARFRSSIIPPWARKSPKVAEVLPLMYLHGMSSGDFAPALTEFFGSAAGLSASVVTRLTRAWQDERERFSLRSLAEVDYVYIWVDGIHFNVRLDESRLCALVIVGVRADGTKELVSITDEAHASTVTSRSRSPIYSAPTSSSRRRPPAAEGGDQPKLKSGRTPLFEPAGRQRHCSSRCRQTAWRRRRGAPVEPVVARSDVVYAYPDCDARYLGEQRCDECNTWCRRLGPGGLCPCCDEPIAISDLLSAAQLAPSPTANRRRR